MNRCNKYNYCSLNVCPLDPDANIRKILPGENRCPFCLNKKTRLQKGIRTRMPDIILKFVPKSNVKLLNRRNQMRWQGLNK